MLNHFICSGNSHWLRIFYAPGACKEPRMGSLNSSSAQFSEAGAVIFSILQMRKLKFPEVKMLIQGHTVNDWAVRTSYITCSPPG